MTDDELIILGRIFRRFIHGTGETCKPYVDILSTQMCIDGWGQLEPGEADLLSRVVAEAKENE